MIMGNYMVHSDPTDKTMQPMIPYSICDSSQSVSSSPNQPDIDEKKLKVAIRSIVGRLLEQHYVEKNHDHESIIKQTANDPECIGLAQMLSTHIDDYLAMAKQSGIVTASTYKCAMNSNHHNTEANLNKINYKNLFPKMDEVLYNGSVPNEYCPNESKCTPHTIRQASLTNSYLDSSNTLNTSLDCNTDTIRINLPEVLDNQDEISILRLLIKLLASKVSKLNDDKRRLLQHVSMLNEINNEMSSIIEHNFKK